MNDTTQQFSSSGTALRFQRRAVLKMMMSVPLAGLATLASPAQEVTRRLGDLAAFVGEGPQWKLRILTLHEWGTVTVLSDWIIPADEECGSASDAEVPRFIDEWLDFQRGSLLAEIREGLAWLDAQCSRSYGSAFTGCIAKQQQQMLDRIAWPDRADPQDARGVVFFSHMRDLVLSGFYTSETGVRYLPYLGNEPQREWQGCPAAVLADLGINV